MQRPIKFRAWDKKKGAWVEGARGFHILGEAMLLGGLFQDYRLKDLNDIILMQYTGLKDKNGVDIYEGDVIKMHPVGCGAVFWDKETAAWGLREEMLYEMNYARDEVIGNIYENPELVEDN